jgi:hypothetical protein
VRKLPSFKETTHRLFRLWFLPREKGCRHDKESGKEAEKGKSSSRKELVYKVESKKVKFGKVLNFLLTL